MDVVSVYQRNDSLWGWRRRSSNGEIIATDGGQGYVNKVDCVKMAQRVNNGGVSVSYEIEGE